MMAGQQACGEPPRYVPDIPYPVRLKLCRSLDADKGWEDLAGDLQYALTDILLFNNAYMRPGGSPTHDLLTSWGHRNPTIITLFKLLANHRRCREMQLLKDLVPEEYHRLMEENFSGNLFERSDSSLSRCSSKSFDENLPPPPQNVENDETLDYKFQHNVTQPASAQSVENGYQRDSMHHYVNEDKLKDISYENEKSMKNVLSPMYGDSQATEKANRNVLSPLYSEGQPSYNRHSNADPHTMRNMHGNSQSEIEFEMMGMKKTFPSHRLRESESDYEMALPVMKDRVLPHEPQESECDFAEPVSAGYSHGRAPELISSLSCEGSELSCPEEAKKYDKLTQFAYSVTPHFSYKEIVGATDGFADHNLQGKGTFGEVYKGTLRKTAFAIKRLIQQRRFEGEEARQKHHHMEIKSLLMYRHDNIVQLIGYSLDGPEVCLIYQFMVNGSLEDRLACKEGTKPIPWHQRCSILKGAARGLQYLHTALDKPLIHGDVKSANILLDKHYEARIGDFGIAQEAQKGSEGKYTHITQKDVGIFGSIAYVPPEFFRNHQMSVKADTYGFGVVIFEACSGKPPFEETEYRGKRTTKFLKDHMGELLDTADDETEWIDERDPYTQDWPDAIFIKLMKLGHYCIMPKKKDRPEMSEVLKSLEDLEMEVQREKYFGHKRYSKDEGNSVSTHMSFEDSSRSFQLNHNSYTQPERKLQENPHYVNEDVIAKNFSENGKVDENVDDPNFFESDPKKMAEIEKFDKDFVSNSADDPRFLAYDKKKLGEETVDGSTSEGPRSMSPLELQKRYDVAKESQSENLLLIEKRPDLERTLSPLQLQMSYDAMKQDGRAQSLDTHLQAKIENENLQKSSTSSLPLQHFKGGKKLQVEHYENIPVHHDYENISNLSETHHDQQMAVASTQPRQPTTNTCAPQIPEQSEIAVEDAMPRKKKLPKAFQQYYDEVAELQKEVENKDANIFFANLEQSKNFQPHMCNDKPEYYNEVCLQRALQEHHESQNQIGDVQQFERRDTSVVQTEFGEQRNTEFLEKRSKNIATESTFAEAESLEHVTDHRRNIGDTTAISQHRHYTSHMTEYVSDKRCVQNPALGLGFGSHAESSPSDIVENLRQRKEELLQSVQKDLCHVSEGVSHMALGDAEPKQNW